MQISVYRHQGAKLDGYNNNARHKFECVENENTNSFKTISLCPMFIHLRVCAYLYFSFSPHTLALSLSRSLALSLINLYTCMKYAGRMYYVKSDRSTSSHLIDHTYVITHSDCSRVVFTKSNATKPKWHGRINTHAKLKATYPQQTAI